MTSEEQYKGNIIKHSHFNIRDISNLEFSANDYSKFKHGASNIAKNFGYALADSFIENCLSKTYTGKQIVLLPSAYSFIPTASYYMSKYFAEKLNIYLYRNNYPVLQESKINRSVTYREDYGEMSATERYNLISNDKFHVDKDFLKDKILLCIDDIRITGTHERIIIKMLNEHNLSNDSYMLYFAELCDPNTSPRFENFLNNHFISSLEDIDWIIKNENFRFNTRVVKYILNADSDKLNSFLKNQSIDFKHKLLINAIGNEYFKFDSYKKNIEFIAQINKL